MIRYEVRPFYLHILANFDLNEISISVAHNSHGRAKIELKLKKRKQTKVLRGKNIRGNILKSL